MLLTTVENSRRLSLQQNHFVNTASYLNWLILWQLTSALTKFQGSRDILE